MGRSVGILWVCATAGLLLGCSKAEPASDATSSSDESPHGGAGSDGSGANSGRGGGSAMTPGAAGDANGHGSSSTGSSGSRVPAPEQAAGSGGTKSGITAGSNEAGGSGTPSGSTMASGGSAGTHASGWGGAQAGAQGGGGRASAGTAGSASAAGVDPYHLHCDSLGKVTFRIQSPLIGYCAPGMCTEESWLSIRKENGEAVPFVTGCRAYCWDCRQAACKCTPYNYVSDAGLTSITWDGIVHQVSSCADSMTCIESECAAPGDYVARMCLYADCTFEEPHCVDVPFHLPQTEEVVGVISK